MSRSARACPCFIIQFSMSSGSARTLSSPGMPGEWQKKCDFFMLGHLDAERLYPRLHLLAPCALQQVGTALR